MLRNVSPTLKFVLLTFLIAYTVGYGLLWLWPSSSGLASQYLPRIGVVYAPAIAAMLVTGREGIGGLLRKLDPRGQWLWVPLLLATGVVCTAAAALVVGVKPRDLTHTAQAWPLFAAHALLQFVFAGCGEELGWRGWLLPQLMTRHRTVVATMIVAAIWGCWHAFILLSGLRTASTFLFGVFGLSFLFTALWQRVNGNIFVLAVAHASVNAPLSLLSQQSVIDAAFVLYGLLGLVVLIWMLTRSNRVLPPSDRQILETVAIAETTSIAATSPAQSPPPEP
ncbi:CPBP family intramembrane glutamic endopeptidase [Terriglobus sp. 2YAB30_2]|uniref:CPBP family intramembrane glutamic endopeptidase n=1 Tax=unclassified Terriglobus TaxID=2628988 RepID=UPI003F957E20